jgi:hypothetical protein
MDPKENVMIVPGAPGMFSGWYDEYGGGGGFRPVPPGQTWIASYHTHPTPFPEGGVTTPFSDRDIINFLSGQSETRVSFVISAPWVYALVIPDAKAQKRLEALTEKEIKDIYAKGYDKAVKDKKPPAEVIEAGVLEVCRKLDLEYYKAEGKPGTNRLPTVLGRYVP